ncbi:MAG: LTA synthase family protein [Zoogloeaceae bacterium]|jgi:phosphoglycerol transferase MdoB-like AlkP superfamily enzyme|nr:LTA synthase family protein [Zoogloeaceae bacterium]
MPTAIAKHFRFIFFSAIFLLALFAFLRLGLMIYNWDASGQTSAAAIFEAFGNGFFFDLRVTAYVLLPLFVAFLCFRLLRARGFLCGWLICAASLAIFLGVIELDFYQEFHQRLNDLVFQYMLEDPKTVLSMLWHGFPVLRLLLLWAVLTGFSGWVFVRVDRATRFDAAALPAWSWRLAAFFVCLLLAALAARGTLRQGPPLRWGDAFTTDSMFANHLGLNGVLTLADSAATRFSSQRHKVWKAVLPDDEALKTTREMLLTRHDKLADAEYAAVRRDFTPPESGRLPIRNVVVILMESFAGRHVGALGATGEISPHFDALAKEGLLFTRFFSNGTHTHQGMFATMGCFPNLPGFEYLMQTPEGGHAFSGLPTLLAAQGFENVYVYNGDFAWDNQYGFFGNQGMTNFVGRNDFEHPVFSDPTWGVSDQDMFMRANEELEKLATGNRPFYAFLQSLSNHTPYALPDDLPVSRVTESGALNEHLTAMRYSDWALGEFFTRAKRAPYYKETLFVVVGDHGFGSGEPLTEMDLYRFNVPLLLIAPGIQEKFGKTLDVVGSQVDIVPTILGRIGKKTRHQCWGRDLLGVAKDKEDEGFAVIKPSGGDQTVAFISGGRILVWPKNAETRLYDYRLGSAPGVRRVKDAPDAQELRKKLAAFISAATKSLLNNTAGATRKEESAEHRQ